MKKVLLLAALLTGPLWADTWKVVGGVGVGPLRLGDSYLAANKVMTPDSLAGDPSMPYLKYKEGVDVACSGQKIVEIVIRKSSFQGRTGPVDILCDGNLRIGASVAQMEAALGRGYTSRDLKVAKTQQPETYYAYVSRGLGVQTRGGKVLQISVFQRR